VTTELNTWDSFCPGHLDRHLYPFYQQGLAEGTLTREQAEELLQCLWIKFNNQPAPPKVGVTAAESGTYTDFAQINLGGVNADGSDGVNEVTYLILDVIEEMRLLQPSSSIQVSSQCPDDFIRRAGKIIRTGFGQPSVFNTEATVAELLRHGKSLADVAKHLVLPSIALGIALTGLQGRITRASMLEVLGMDYITTARAKGLRERVVILGHALKNALIPIVTVFGLQFAVLMGGAVLTETVFSWPGIASYLVHSIGARDYDAIQGSVVFIALFISTINLIVDVFYSLIDPRVRY